MTDRNYITKLINDELKDANAKHPQFHSPHEAYAVILEEWEETIEELIAVKEAINDMWQSVRDDDEDGVFDTVNRGYDYAVDALRELIQVCAMFKKAAYTNVDAHEIPS